MNKEFVMRGKTDDFKVTGKTEVLNFSGNKPGYAYRLVEFKLYPSTAIGASSYEIAGSITAGKTVADPENPDFSNEGLIASSIFAYAATGSVKDTTQATIVNDTFLITQDLILAVVDTFDGNNIPVNWQCRFIAEKLNNGEEAVTNFRQFTISND